MEEDCIVTFLPENKTVKVSRGTLLIKAAAQAGVHINASCGNEGVCGKCRVIIERGEYTTGVTPFLTKDEVNRNYCLACLTLVEGDLLVRVPVESQAGKAKILIGTLEDKKTIEVASWELTPRTKKIFLELPPPSITDNLSDFERLTRELRKNGYEDITCSLSILKKMASAVRKKLGKITVTVLETNCTVEITDIEPGDSTRHHFGLAIDIGTTSIVIYIIDLLTGKIIDVASDYNSQIKCGADIISRIVYSTQHGGLLTLHNLVITTINELIQKLLTERNINQKLIDSVVISGNTTMTHLFLGLDPRHIREDPYIPTVNSVPLLKGGELNLKTNKNAYVYCMPIVSSYIGGDITAGILASEVYRKKDLTMFIDIGTNGEIVLGNSEWMVSASCSAGPAFEGGGVKFGIRAQEGAIEGIIINSENHEPIYSTIGGHKPHGICGSGIIDIVAELYIKGIINQKGKIQKDLSSKRIREGECGMEYVIVWKEDTDDAARDIVFTEADIDNIIRTKGAIYAGFSVLLNQMGFTFHDINMFLIAGGFGNYLNIEKAIIIGMLPDLPTSRFKYIGNTSVLGAQLVLLSNKMRKDAEYIAKNITYVELSVSPLFMNEYISSLFLPHTNIDTFPNVKKLIKTI
ncbi:MAG: DUF4445 domain-containing protein [Candidatus Firestonebacteria bacterium]|nr:DUF4445 domain-containing protein [Candidatus Firestonebacteria bacterium]